MHIGGVRATRTLTCLWASAPLAGESLTIWVSLRIMVTPVGFEPDTSGLRGLRLDHFDYAVRFHILKQNHLWRLRRLLWQKDMALQQPHRQRCSLKSVNTRWRALSSVCQFDILQQKVIVICCFFALIYGYSLKKAYKILLSVFTNHRRSYIIQKMQ